MTRRLLTAGAFALGALTLPAARAGAQQAHYTKGGYPGCLTRELHDKFTSYLVNKENDLAVRMITRGQCVMLKKGIQVYLEDTKIFSGQIQIRPRRSELTIWTNLEAIT